MNPLRNNLVRRIAFLALPGMLALASGHALADTYNLVLKQSGSPLYCTVGGFSFTKTGVGSSPATGMSVQVTNGSCVMFTTPVSGVGTHLPAMNFSAGTGAQPNVIVRDIFMNGEPQGPNVDGLAGDLSNGVPSGNGRYILRLKSSATGDRSFTILRGTQAREVATGTYHFVNTKNVITSPITVPEPAAPLLLLAGFGALGLVRGLKRKAA